jgi:hypothetical protein
MTFLALSYLGVSILEDDQQERHIILPLYCYFVLTGTEQDRLLAVTWQWEKNSSLRYGGKWVANPSFRNYLEPLLNDSISALKNIRNITEIYYGDPSDFYPFPSMVSPSSNVPNFQNPYAVMLRILPAIPVFVYGEYRGGDSTDHLIQPQANDIQERVQNTLESFWFVARITSMGYPVTEG